MTKITRSLLGATALMLIATPSLAEERDRILPDQYRDKIAAVRAEPGVAENGAADLDQATASLATLRDRLDENEAGEAKAIIARIDALIETARTRAKVAAAKAELDQLKTASAQRSEAEIAAAQAQAQLASAEAEAAKAAAAKAQTQLRDYQMKQTALGATLVLQDVVFETGKADLKPGAAERLRPLAQYLAANTAVKVQIDGHTDAQGSDSYNRSLSDRRASAIKAALASMSIDPARIQAIGHGESTPVADNKTAAGRQQNRRVEITIVGQKTADFAAVTQ